MNDARYAIRQLRNTPGFTAIALLTLTIGIGACTAIFSVVNKVLLQPLPYPHPEELLRIYESNPPDLPIFSNSPGDALEWASRSTTVAKFGISSYDAINLTGLGEPVRVSGLLVSANYLSVLGVMPAMGRNFAEGEDAKGRDGVAIVSDYFWKRQFGGRADVIGQVLRVNGSPTTVIGVMPPSFQGPDVMHPLAFTPEDRNNHGGHYLQVTARMKPGVTAAQARSELKAISADIARKHPESNKGWTVLATPLLDDTVGSVRPQLYALLAAVGFLLLIGCTNVANLLLVRAAARSKEIAVRAAIGAGRIRLVRQLVVENLVLALLGGLGGAVAAYWGVQLLVKVAPSGVPRASEVAVDGWALGFCIALALLTGIGFGLVPAIRASKVDLNVALKDAGRGTSEGRASLRLRDALVVAELTVALVLLVGAGLLMRTFVKLEKVDPGFRAESAYMFNAVLPSKKYDTNPKQAAFAEALSEKLSRIPGVTYAGATQAFPFYSDYVLGLAIEEKKVAPENTPSINYYTVTPRYFRAMGVPLLKGREFDARDVAGSELVTIISKGAADRFFPGEDPIGKRVNIQNPDGKWSVIVGVVGDVKQYGLRGDAPPEAYEPFSQHPYTFQSYVLRLSGKPVDLAGSIRAAVRAVDPEQPVDDVRTVDSMLKGSISSQHFAMNLFVTFSGAAVVLATIGIYGVMAYSVSQRRAEIGVRMALGAQNRDVLGMIALQGARLIAIGVAGGLVGSVILTRLIASQLYGVGAMDPLTLACACAILAIAALCACLLSAMRATRIDPIVALRAN